MKWSKAILRIGIALVLVPLVLAFALWMKPPEILRVGANYSAKIVCSNVFLAGRDPDEVLRTDVQAPGVALLRLMRVSVDREQRVVHAGLLGFTGDGLALARPRTGCAVVPDGNLDFAMHVGSAAAQPVAAHALWSNRLLGISSGARGRYLGNHRLAQSAAPAVSEPCVDRYTGYQQHPREECGMPVFHDCGDP